MSHPAHVSDGKRVRALAERIDLECALRGWCGSYPAGPARWVAGGFWAPDGIYSRFVSPLIGLVWLLVVSRIILARSPMTGAGW